MPSVLRNAVFGAKSGAALVVALVLSMAPVADQAHARAAPDSFAGLAEQLSPAVVNISTTQTIKRSAEDIPLPQFPPGSPFEDMFREFLERGQGDQAPRKVASLGSGFVIDSSGVIVTNNHVIDGAEEVTATFPDGTTLPATVVGHDAKADIAVLRVKTSKPLTAVKFGNSENMRVGDWVLAIGNPFGLGGSVSAGIISARNRDINAGPYDDFIQTDAAINRGNSGGPLFNMDGEVIGVNSAIISPSGGSIGIGFAVPANMVQPVVAQLLKYGETRRGWLGVRIQSVTDDMAEALGLDKAKGALVAGVTDPGPAAKAGIKPGDVIVKFNGRDIADMRALPRVVADTEIGKSVPVEFLRNGQLKSVQVSVGRLEDAEKVASAEEGGEGAKKGQTPAKPTGTKSLGLTLSPLSGDLRRQFGITEDIKGVLITDVDPKGPAAEKGIRPGDIVAEVSQEAVSKPEDIVNRVKQAEAAKKKSVLLLVNRNGELSFIAVRIG